MTTETLSWRDERPIFVEREAPCRSGCPAGENIREWLSLAQAGDYHAAWRALTAVNPLPACMGRICYHPCENACNRTHVDGAVNINAVERFLGDEAIRQGWRFDTPECNSGKRVLVVGAGPSGLSAAYHLRRLGYSVVIRDAAPAGGGMMRYGIPPYRLPRAVLDHEIARIADMGIGMLFGDRIEHLAQDMSDFDSVYLAVGAHVGKRTDSLGLGRNTVDAIAFLRALETGETPHLGRQVVVYGGGNTAIDAARSVRRLGAKVTIVYRRTRQMMPAYDFEVEEALAEGVAIRWLSTIKSVNGNGMVALEDMELDGAGFPQPTGRIESIPADTILLALGQDPDFAVVRGVPGLDVSKGVLHVDPAMMTGAPGIFAGGDMARSVRTATSAIGDGRNAARHIDAWLRGETVLVDRTVEQADFDKLHTWYYTRETRTEHKARNTAERVCDFGEIVAGLSETDARREAGRCLSCGHCFGCESCEDVCPEDAITRAGSEFDLAKCTTCKLCIKECPCGAIALAPR